MMSAFRNSVAIAYMALLLLGGLLSLAGFDAAWRGYNDAVEHSGARWFDDFGWRVLPDAVVSTGWLLLTAAYAVVFVRKGLNLALPFLYVLSGVLIGIVFIALTSALKDGVEGAHVVIVGGLAVFASLSAISGFCLNQLFHRPTIINVAWRRLVRA